MKCERRVLRNVRRDICPNLLVQTIKRTIRITIKRKNWEVYTPRRSSGVEP
jgi:hypothetical protein